jgi:ribonucleoside-triphosphate reductase
MRNLEVIKQELSEAREALSHVEGTPTEVYSRIVGYYRSVRNWNKGKREEYDERKLFHSEASFQKIAEKEFSLFQQQADTRTEEELLQREDADITVLLFVRASCPACPKAKEAAFKLGIPVTLINADTDEGFAAAHTRQVMSTPTAIFLGKDGNEICRARSATEITAFAAAKSGSFAAQAVVSPV